MYCGGMQPSAASKGPFRPKGDFIYICVFFTLFSESELPWYALLVEIWPVGGWNLGHTTYRLHTLHIIDMDDGALLLVKGTHMGAHAYYFSMKYVYMVKIVLFECAPQVHGNTNN